MEKESNLDPRFTEISKAINNDLQTSFMPEMKGGIQRFAATEKIHSNRACWIWINEDFSYAKYGSHITGETFTWISSESKKLSPEAKAEANIRKVKYKKLREEKLKNSQLVAAKEARSIIDSAVPALDSYPYLLSKNVKPHGILQHESSLIVPLFGRNEEICNLQRITDLGAKYFHKGCQLFEAHAVIGKLFSTDTLYIAEGWATAATIHEQSGHPVIAAMTAGNLIDVCKLFASKIPEHINIVIAADNDHFSDRNTGLTKAKKAATAIGVSYVVPPLPCNFSRCRCTDFNDYQHCKKQIKDNSND